MIHRVTDHIMQLSTATRRFLTVFAGLHVLACVAVRLLMDRGPTGAQAANWLFGYAILAFVISLAAIFVMLRRARRRDRQLSELAGEIEQGHYRALERLPSSVPRDDSLVAAMRQMASGLASRQHRLQESLAQMNAVLGSMIEGVIATGADGRILLANDAAIEMLSRTRDELIGHRLLDSARFTELRTAIEDAQRTREPQKTEFETIVPPRRQLQVSVTALPEPSSGGLTIVLQDVTDLRKMETMRRDFVANVSHELKTPLASIKACAETLRLGALYDNQANTGFVQQIEAQAELLEQQVQGLLQLSEVQAGELTLQRVPVDINNVCRCVIGQFDSEAVRRSVQLSLQAVDGPLVITTDEDAIHTIVRNLVSNALRYTRPAGSVVVRTGRESAQVIVEVVDTGIGIAADEQERVFERFYRVDEARSREQGGSGLGLAIVKHLARALGGSVTLSSRIGKGSQFRVSLPIRP